MLCTALLFEAECCWHISHLFIINIYIYLILLKYSFFFFSDEILLFLLLLNYRYSCSMSPAETISACGTGDELSSLLLDPSLSPLAAAVARWALDHTRERFLAHLSPARAALVYFRALSAQDPADLLSESEMTYMRHASRNEEDTEVSVASKLCNSILSSDEVLPFLLPRQRAAKRSAEAEGEDNFITERDWLTLQGIDGSVEGEMNKREDGDAMQDGEPAVVSAAALGVPAFLGHYDYVQQIFPNLEDCLLHRQRELQTLFLRSVTHHTQHNQ